MFLRRKVLHQYLFIISGLTASCPEFIITRIRNPSWLLVIMSYNGFLVSLVCWVYKPSQNAFSQHDGDRAHITFEHDCWTNVLCYLEMCQSCSRRLKGCLHFIVCWIRTWSYDNILLNHSLFRYYKYIKMNLKKIEEKKG